MCVSSVAAASPHLEIWSCAYFFHNTRVVLGKPRPENDLLTLIWTSYNNSLQFKCLYVQNMSQT